MPQIVNKKSVLEMAMGAIAEITDYEVERVVPTSWTLTPTQRPSARSPSR